MAPIPMSAKSEPQLRLKSRPSVFSLPRFSKGALAKRLPPVTASRWIRLQNGLPVGLSEGLEMPLAFRHCS